MEGDLSLQEVELIGFLKGEEAVLPDLYPNVVGQYNEGLALFGLNLFLASNFTSPLETISPMEMLLPFA
jgi:hypothetical protein